MSVTVSTNGINGDKLFDIEEGDDTNLMLPYHKKAFTVLRSSYNDADGNTQYEFWVKCAVAKRWNYWESWYPCKGIRSVDGIVYDGCGNEYYPQRNQSAPVKVVFDSKRTSAFNDISASLPYPYGTAEGFSDTAHSWAYVGSSVDGIFGNACSGDFDLYGHLGYFYFNDETSVFVSDEEEITVEYEHINEARMCVAGRLIGESELKTMFDPYYSDNLFKNVFSGKIAEIRNWEVVSNSTPEQNKYYVAIKDRDGNLLDVKWTTSFGETVGSVIGEYAVMFGDDVKNQRVVDDWVIRMK